MPLLEIHQLKKSFASPDEEVRLAGGRSFLLLVRMRASGAEWGKWIRQNHVSELNFWNPPRRQRNNTHRRPGDDLVERGRTRPPSRFQSGLYFSNVQPFARLHLLRKHSSGECRFVEENQIGASQSAFWNG